MINKQSWNVMKLKGNWRILTHKHIARWLKHGAPNQWHETALLICSQAFVCKQTRYCGDIIQQCGSPTCNKTIICMVLVWQSGGEPNIPKIAGDILGLKESTSWEGNPLTIERPVLGNVSNPWRRKVYKVYKVVPTTCFAQLVYNPMKNYTYNQHETGEKML